MNAARRVERDSCVMCEALISSTTEAFLAGYVAGRHATGGFGDPISVCPVHHSKLQEAWRVHVGKGIIG